MPRTIMGPATITLDAGSPSQFVITPDMQLNDASLTVTEMTQDTATQSTDQDATFIIDLMVSGQFSISDLASLDFFAKIYHGSDTRETAGETTAVGLAARPGCLVDQYPILIQLNDCDGVTTDKNYWYYLPAASFFTENSSIAFGRKTQQELTVSVRGYVPDVANPYYPYKAIRGDYTLFAV
jgi:hypothetical protein